MDADSEAHKRRRRNAALKAAETKGAEERKREALMAGWTRKNGKNDAANPYSKQNWHGPQEVRRTPALAAALPIIARKRP
jgi:hypothetical protein